jgi:hypothetical protein
MDGDPGRPGPPYAGPVLLTVGAYARERPSTLPAPGAVGRLSPVSQIERVAPGMSLEQQTGVVVARIVRLVPDPGTCGHLFDRRGAQCPADPPLDVVALLAERAVRTVVAELQLALMIRSDGLGGEGAPLEPEKLEVAELDPCRTPFTGREHEDTVLAPRGDSDPKRSLGCCPAASRGSSTSAPRSRRGSRSPASPQSATNQRPNLIPEE